MSRRSLRPWGFNERGLFCAGLTSWLLACSAGGGDGASTTSPAAGAPPVAAGGSSSGASLNGGSGIVLMVAGTGNDDSGGSGGKPADQVVTSLPPGFQQTEIGGYKLGERMGSAQADDGMAHNFGFTTELHTQFIYKGGETFTFEGDDDVWVYINNRLAVDLGGLHPMQSRPVQLDAVAAELGIIKGTVYPLDLFHAERHTTASTFRIDTNLSFVDCGTVIPSVVK